MLHSRDLREALDCSERERETNWGKRPKKGWGDFPSPLSFLVDADGPVPALRPVPLPSSSGSGLLAPPEAACALPAAAASVDTVRWSPTCKDRGGIPDRHLESPIPEAALQLWFPHRALAAAACGAFVLTVGSGPSFADPGVEPPAVIESSFGNAPFLTWDPPTEKVYTQELGHADYSAEIHYDLGLYFYEVGEYELSLKHYRRATEIDPQFPEAYFGIGLLFYTLGDDENAIRYYRESLARDPDDADTRNNLGLIHYRRGELVLAREQIEEAVRLQPDFPDALYNLGLVYYQQSELQSAVTNFLAALRLDPEYLRARFNLGVVYFEMGMMDLAEEQWLAISETAPGTPLADQARENLAIIHEK